MVKKNMLKNRIAFSSSLENSLYEKLEIVSQKTKIPKSRLFDEAIEYIIQKYSK